MNYVLFYTWIALWLLGLYLIYKVKDMTYRDFWWFIYGLAVGALPLLAITIKK